MRKLHAWIAALAVAAGLLFVQSDAPTAASPSWKTLAKSYEVGSAYRWNRYWDAQNVSADAISRRDPSKVQVVLTWTSPTKAGAKIYFNWGKLCWNGTEGPYMGSGTNEAYGNRVVRLDAGQTFRRTWTTGKDFCQLRADAMVETRETSWPPYTPPGKLVMEIRDRA